MRRKRLRCLLNSLRVKKDINNKQEKTAGEFPAVFLSGDEEIPPFCCVLKKAGPCFVRIHDYLFSTSLRVKILSIKPYSSARSAVMKLSRSVSREITSIGWPVRSDRI